MNQPSGRAFISSPNQTYLCAVTPDTLLFGRGVNLDFAVLAPGVIFELASQGVADGDRASSCLLLDQAAANDEFVSRQK
jgi:hypothetical protein